MSRPAAGAVRPLGAAAAFAALVFWGGQAVIAKGVDLDPLPLVLYRIWLAAAWTVLFLRLTGGKLSRRVLRICLWGGVAFGADLILFFTALKHTTVANTTVIASMQPVLLVFAAPRLFGERIRLPDLAWAAVAIAGVAAVVFGSRDASPEWSPSGDLWAVATLFAWTGYFVASKLARAEVSAAEFTAAASVVAAVFVTPFVLASGQDLGPPTADQWFWITMMAIGPGWAGHYLMNWALGHIPIWLGGVAALASPVVSAVMAWIFLDEALVGAQLVGMGITLGALTAITLRAQAAPAPASAQPDPAADPAGAA
ncbi:MAG: DMT family transporter [Acidimicrobiales bacterium]